MTQQENIPYSEDPFMAEALAFIYIAQFVRADGPTRAGVLLEDCSRYSSQIKHLLSAGTIQNKSWVRLEGFVTTETGTQQAQAIVHNLLLTQNSELEANLGGIPQRCLQYLQDLICANGFDFSDEGRQIKIYEKTGHHDTFNSNRQTYCCLLSNRDIHDMRDHLFQTLTTMKLMVKARNYNSGKGGQVLDYLYIPAPELQSFLGDYLAKIGLTGSLWSEELEDIHNVFHILEGNYNNTLPGQDELDRKIPVRYREDVSGFINECIGRKKLSQSTDNIMYHQLIINDCLWYDTERKNRYQKPLLDFLLSLNSPQSITATAKMDYSENSTPAKYRGKDVATTSTLPIRVFYSYAQEDDSLRSELEKHLSMLKRERIIAGWHFRMISGGKEWKGEIDAHLSKSNMILLLVSSDFIASDYCYDVEMKKAMELHSRKEARVIPVIIRPCDWRSAPFGKLEALPEDAKAITSWQNRDEGFFDVTKGIRKVAEELQIQSACYVPATSFSIIPGITISRGSGTPGTSVTVCGSGFAANETGITVIYDGITVISGIVADHQGGWSGTFVVPPSASGSHNINAYGKITPVASVPARAWIAV